MSLFVTKKEPVYVFVLLFILFLRGERMEAEVQKDKKQLIQRKIESSSVPFKQPK